MCIVNPIGGIYGLKQATCLAKGHLFINLKPHGYCPSCYAPNIWVHTAKPTKCYVCVDDFGVKYTSDVDTDHLIRALKISYQITVDTKGSGFCGLHLDCYYTK